MKIRNTDVLIKLLFVFLFFNIFSLAWSNESTLIDKSTLALVKLSQNSSANQLKQEQLAPFIQLAKERRDEIVKDLQNNSKNVIKYLLPNKIVKLLPRQIQSFVETEITNLEGSLELRVADQKDKEIIQYLLHLDNGTQYYLYFTDKADDKLQTNTRIKISHAINIPTVDNVNKLVISSKDLKIIRTVNPQALVESFGPQKTIVMLVNFQDQPSVRPYTIDQVKNVVFGQVSNIFYESSYHQTTVVGDAVGWFTVAINSNSSCDAVTNILPGLAATAATQAGVNLSNYTRRVYMFPKNYNCTWGGLGSIGRWGGYSQTWLNGYNSSSVTGHEMGHNLGLFHSHLLLCDGSSNQGTCLNSEYGDKADIMGGGGNAHFNAYQKERLGWLNYQISPPIKTVTSSGTYTIAPYETFNNSVPKALKILKATYSDSSKDYLYVEFRQPQGYDAGLNCNGCDFTKGVLIHQGNDRNPNMSYLLDMTPHDDSPYLVSLLPGRSFQDTAAAGGGATISVDSISSSGAVVRVGFGGNPAACTRAPHTLTVTPTTTQWIAPGQSYPFVATVRNNDSLACTTSTFSVTATATPPITAFFDHENQNMVLNPGESGSVLVQAGSDQTATPGLYSLKISSVNTSNTLDTNTVTANLGITQAMCVQANPLIKIIPSCQSTTVPGTALNYTISVTNKDSAGCPNSTFKLTGFIPGGGTWAGIVSPNSLVLSPGQTSTAAHFTVTSPSNATKGSYDITVAATNALNLNFYSTDDAAYLIE